MNQRRLESIADETLRLETELQVVGGQCRARPLVKVRGNAVHGPLKLLASVPRPHSR